MKTNPSIRRYFVVVALLIVGPAALSAAEAPKTGEEWGSVKEVDIKGRQITVVERKTKKERIFSWNNTTQFELNGKNAGVGALKVGRPAHLIYETSSSIPHLDRVEIVSEKQASPTAPAGTPKKSHAN